MAKLEKGEEYITVSIGGKDGLKIALFPNKEKKGENDPDYLGSISLAGWNNKKR